MIKVGERKISSYSVGQNNCVEVELTTPDTVAVRDTKVHGPAIRASVEALSALLRGVQ